MEWYTSALACASVAAFTLCGIDKQRAKRSAMRIPERTLLGIAVLGGAGGLILGMLLFRHKIRKPVFVGLAPAFLILQILLFAVLRQNGI